MSTVPNAIWNAYNRISKFESRFKNFLFVANFMHKILKYNFQQGFVKISSTGHDNWALLCVILEDICCYKICFN